MLTYRIKMLILRCVNLLLTLTFLSSFIFALSAYGDLPNKVKSVLYDYPEAYGHIITVRKELLFFVLIGLSLFYLVALILLWLPIFAEMRRIEAKEQKEVRKLRIGQLSGLFFRIYMVFITYSYIYCFIYQAIGFLNLLIGATVMLFISQIVLMIAVQIKTQLLLSKNDVTDK